MKKSSVYQFAVLALGALFLGGYASPGLAEGLFLRIGGDGQGHHFRSSGHRTYGPATSFIHSYGPVTSIGGQHRLSGRNQYNLSITRSGVSLHDRRFGQKHGHRKHSFKRHRGHGGFDSGYKHGYRDGYRDAQHRNRALYYRWKR